MRSAHEIEGEPLPVARDAERPLPHAGSGRGPRWEIERVQTWSLYRTGARTTAGAFESASAHEGCRGSGKRVGGGN
jgi:hypothetical protein